MLATTFLSGISGSSVADVSAIGSVMIPQMEKVGYPRVFATNVTITGSVQAILVPPSHNAVIYSLATGGTISIISLFMAGVVPGLLLGFALIGLCMVIAYRDRHPSGDAVPLREAVQHHDRCAWGLITLIIIIGGILRRHLHRDRSRRGRLRLGVLASRCSSTAITAGAICRGLVHRTLRTVAMVMTLIACASGFGYVMALMQMPAKITAFFLTISDNKYVILILINIHAAGARLPDRHGAARS